jgi:hypothetical protein
VLVCERHVWQGKRQENKESSATAALALLQRHLRRVRGD